MAQNIVDYLLQGLLADVEMKRSLLGRTVGVRAIVFDSARVVSAALGVTLGRELLDSPSTQAQRREWVVARVERALLAEQRFRLWAVADISDGQATRNAWLPGPWVLRQSVKATYDYSLQSFLNGLALSQADAELARDVIESWVSGIVQVWQGAHKDGLSIRAEPPFADYHGWREIALNFNRCYEQAIPVVLSDGWSAIWQVRQLTLFKMGLLAAGNISWRNAAGTTAI